LGSKDLEFLKDKAKSLAPSDFHTLIVDQAGPVKQIQDSLLGLAGIKKGTALYDSLNVYAKWHTFFGKGYHAVEQAQLEYIEPIQASLREHSIGQEEFGEYLLARRAPSMNAHLKKIHDEALAELDAGTDKYKALKKQGANTSGITDAEAIATVTRMESDAKFLGFLKDARNPLQSYYDMNLAALDLKQASGLLRSSKEINEHTAMKKAATTEWGKGKFKSQITSKDGYSYAPMQGFKDETQRLYEQEELWGVYGKANSSTGKGFDQPKSKFMPKGAGGRQKNTPGPDPHMTLSVSTTQYFDAAVRANKNEVSRAFGELFENFRAIAYPDSPGSKELRESELFPEELKNLSKEEKDALSAEFREVFAESNPETKESFEYDIIEEMDKSGKTTKARLRAVKRTVSTQFQNDPSVFVYRKDGEAHAIKFQGIAGARVARSLKNLRYESLPSILQGANKVTRFMAGMFTSMNPAFIAPNFFRDIGTALIHLTEDDKKKMAKDALNFKNVGGHMKAIFKAERMIAQGKNPLNTKDLSIDKKTAMELLLSGDKVAQYQFAKAAGAKIGYFRHKTVPESIDDLIKATTKAPGATKRGFKAALNFVDNANTAVENSIRMSAFWAAIKNGYTVQEAATISRNVTVDFNQKGELTQTFGAAFVFFGASVNAAHRMVKSFKARSGKDKAKLAASVIGASFTVAMFNRLMDDDEDEEKPDYDTISSYKRDTNFIVPMPAAFPGNDERDTGYFSIPLPLGYNALWAAGQVIADMFIAKPMGRGGENMLDGTTRLLEAAVTAFNPMGSGSLMTMLSPTLAKPGVEIWANKNFMGRPIRYDDIPFQAPEPGHMQDPKSTPEHWKNLSKSINEFMGGNDQRKGTVQGIFGFDPADVTGFEANMSGNQMRHFVMGYLGGPGQIADWVFGGLVKSAKGEAFETDVGRIPLMNRFMRGSTYGASTRDDYYTIREAVKEAEAVVKGAAGGGSSAVTAAKKENKKLLSMSELIKAVDANKKKFRERKLEIENSKSISEEEKTQRVDDLERKELKLFTNAVIRAQNLGINI